MNKNLENGIKTKRLCVFAMMKEIHSVYQKILEELDQVSDVCKDGRIKKLWKDIQVKITALLSEILTFLQHLNDLYEKYFYIMVQQALVLS